MENNKRRAKKCKKRHRRGRAFWRVIDEGAARRTRTPKEGAQGRMATDMPRSFAEFQRVQKYKEVPKGFGGQQALVWGQAPVSRSGRPFISAEPPRRERYIPQTAEMARMNTNDLKQAASAQGLSTETRQKAYEELLRRQQFQAQQQKVQERYEAQELQRKKQWGQQQAKDAQKEREQQYLEAQRRGLEERRGTAFEQKQFGKLALQDADLIDTARARNQVIHLIAEAKKSPIRRLQVKKELGFALARIAGLIKSNKYPQYQSQLRQNYDLYQRALGQMETQSRSLANSPLNSFLFGGGFGGM